MDLGPGWVDVNDRRSIRREMAKVGPDQDRFSFLIEPALDRKAFKDQTSIKIGGVALDLARRTYRRVVP